MNNYNYNGFKRINKRIARKLYNDGVDVLFIPCKLRPDNMWGLGIWENVNLSGQYGSFDKLCNEFIWYNCNFETGNYIAFYIKD